MIAKKHTSGFTLIELLLVMVIMGILSLLLFRSLGDMTRIAGRIEFEKTLSNNLMTIHTITNYLSEQYPHIDMTHYNQVESLNQGYTTGLYLIANNKTDKASLVFSNNDLQLYESKTNKTVSLFYEKKIILTGGMFRLLPMSYYENDVIELDIEQVNAGGFWIFGSIHPKTNNTLSQNISLNLQHFVHLKK